MSIHHRPLTAIYLMLGGGRNWWLLALHMFHLSNSASQRKIYSVTASSVIRSSLMKYERALPRQWRKWYLDRTLPCVDILFLRIPARPPLTPFDFDCAPVPWPWEESAQLYRMRSPNKQRCGKNSTYLLLTKSGLRRSLCVHAGAIGLTGEKICVKLIYCSLASITWLLTIFFIGNVTFLLGICPTATYSLMLTQVHFLTSCQTRGE